MYRQNYVVKFFTEKNPPKVVLEMMSIVYVPDFLP